MNSYKVELLSEARLELRDIATFHKMKVGANSARRVTNRILDSIEKLSDFPEIAMAINDVIRIL
jgi:plasmid stabilization system protein ParE